MRKLRNRKGDPPPPVTDVAISKEAIREELSAGALREVGLLTGDTSYTLRPAEGRVLRPGNNPVDDIEARARTLMENLTTIYPITMANVVRLMGVEVVHRHLVRAVTHAGNDQIHPYSVICELQREALSYQRDLD